MRDLLVGIDAGTSMIKAIAFDLKGKQIGEFAIPNRYETRGTAAEQDMARTWTDTAATLRGLAEKVPDLPTRTSAIAVTGQGDGTWLVDGSGTPVAPAWLWLDARAAAIVDAIRSGKDDPERFRLTGTGLAACQQGPQLAWMKRNVPDVLKRAAHAIHCKDWLYYNLTGEIATDPSEGNFTYGDFRSRRYSDAVIAAIGLENEKRLLPRMVEGTEESAALTANAAAETGMLAGTPVVLGYVDVICTALGAGIYDARDLPGVTIVGSTGMHMRMVPRAEDAALNHDRTGYTMAMPVPGVYAQMQSNMASTLNIDWVLSMASDVLASQGMDKSARDLLHGLDEIVSKARPTGLLYQPYISEAGERGPFIDANARAGFVGLSMSHGFGDLARAVFEGLAFAARDCYAAMGPVPGQLRLTGGAARSKMLRRILGAAVGTPVRTSAREEAGAAGAAMMAAVRIGQYKTMQDCAADWVDPLLGDIENTDRDLVCAYERAFPAYAAAHMALRPVWAMMAEQRKAARS